MKKETVENFLLVCMNLLVCGAEEHPQEALALLRQIKRSAIEYWQSDIREIYPISDEQVDRWPGMQIQVLPLEAAAAFSIAQRTGHLWDAQRAWLVRDLGILRFQDLHVIEYKNEAGQLVYLATLDNPEW